MNWRKERESLEDWCESKGGELEYIKSFGRYPFAAKCEGGDFTVVEREGYGHPAAVFEQDEVLYARSGSLLRGHFEPRDGGGARFVSHDTDEAVRMSESIWEAHFPNYDRSEPGIRPTDGAVQPDPKEVSRRGGEWTPVSKFDGRMEGPPTDSDEHRRMER